MNVSSVLQITVLLAMISAYLATDASFGLAASRRRISIRKYRTNYRIDSWDDGRDAPYRVTFWKFGLKSVYTFDVAGNIKTLTARNTLYTFDTDIGAMLLLASNDDVDDDAIEDVDVDPSSAIDCSVCHVTWDTLCDKGITDVCYLHENPLDDFDEDAIDSVRRFCSAFGAACEMSAADACDGQCTVDTTSAPTSAPTAEDIETMTVEPTEAPTTRLVQATDYTAAPTPDLVGGSTPTPAEASATGL